MLTRQHSLTSRNRRAACSLSSSRSSLRLPAPAYGGRTSAHSHRMRISKPSLRLGLRIHAAGLVSLHAS